MRGNRVGESDAGGSGRAVIFHDDGVGDVVAGLHGIRRGGFGDDDVGTGRATHQSEYACCVIREIGIVGAG